MLGVVRHLFVFNCPGFEMPAGLAGARACAGESDCRNLQYRQTGVLSPAWRDGARRLFTELAFTGFYSCRRTVQPACCISNFDGNPGRESIGRCRACNESRYNRLLVAVMCMNHCLRRLSLSRALHTYGTIAMNASAISGANHASGSYYDCHCHRHSICSVCCYCGQAAISQSAYISQASCSAATRRRLLVFLPMPM